WDPSVPGNPAYRWSLPYPQGFSFRGAWQAHCTGDPRADGVHMVLTVSNQNYAMGGRIAYYWSPDWGETWVGHPSNPIIVPGTHPDGVPATGFQRTPTLLVDEQYRRYVLAYNAGHDIDEPWKRRTHLAVAPRPAPPDALGDIDADGAVGVSDFLLLLAAWGPCPADCCLADLDSDGSVGVSDFLLLLAHWS
ncbi:MAG: dockerin type I repeat-containing protein, partial [Planctomycetota bacterium]